MAYGPENSARLCRLCLSDSGIRMPIFEDETNDAVDIFLPSKILSCVSIRVEKKDPYPLWICQQCKMKIDDIYEFRMLCKMSDTKLKSSHEILAAKKKNIEENEDIPHGCLIDDDMIQRAVPNTLIKVSHTESIIKIRQEPVEFLVPHIYIKQGCEEDFNMEDTSTQQFDENESYGEDKTSTIEELSGFNNHNYAFSIETKQEKFEEEEEEEMEQTSSDDYNQPLHFLLENENNSENRSEIKKQRVPKLVRLECPICKCPYTYESTLAKHVKTCIRKGFKKTRGQKKKLTCKICKAVLASDGAAVKHEKLHRTPPTFTCNTCTISFKEKGELICHQAKYHRAQVNKNIAQQKLFKCRNCSLIFTKMEELISHQAQYHVDNSYKNMAQHKFFACGTCNLAFAKKGELICHHAKQHRDSIFKSKMLVYRQASSDSCQNTAAKPDN